jgi:hypothetical protein
MAQSYYSDDSLPTGSQPITILETAKVYIANNISIGLGTSQVDRKDSYGAPKDSTTFMEFVEGSMELQSSFSAGDPAAMDTFVLDDGYGYYITKVDVSTSSTDAKKYSVSFRRCVNSLITAPAYGTVTLANAAPITAIDLTLNTNAPSGGSWAVSGCAGLAIVGTTIAGTITEADAAVVPMIVSYTYTESVYEPSKRALVSKTRKTERVITVTVS